MIIKYNKLIIRDVLVIKNKFMKEDLMANNEQMMMYDIVEDNLSLVSKIYQSFEALEETLGALKLEEPLFITYAAKKSFAQNIMKTTNSANKIIN